MNTTSRLTPTQSSNIQKRDAEYVSSNSVSSGDIIQRHHSNSLSSSGSQSRKNSQNYPGYSTASLSNTGSQALKNGVQRTPSLTNPAIPIPSMHWSKLKARGSAPPRALRAHTMTQVNDQLFVFGGCDSGVCFNDLFVFDVETMCWSQPHTSGDIPKPCRAHSSVYLDGKIYIFGGGDGPNYFNTLYCLDVETLQWTELTPPPGPSPGPRRAHTSWAYDGCIYVYAGGDGVRALNDIYVLVINGDQFMWHSIETRGPLPSPRGYHTSNLVGSRLVVYGGSDGHECFSDVHILDLTTFEWMECNPLHPISRLSHSSTQVGSYLFVFGGHDGITYSNDVLLLNLVTMGWEERKVFGISPSGRGYHTAILSDSRVYVYGGYDGQEVFNDMWVLDLSGCAYLPQITTFDIAADFSES
ncbi:hypothetical protein HK096_008897, partial [Nowakowskiella sp. JEL0078]